MKRHLGIWLAFACVALLAITASASSGPTGVVKGSVSAADGPIVGARVVISSGADSSYTASTTTDKEGAFTFSNAPVGDLELKVYNAQDTLIATGKGVLKAADEVITVVLKVP
jgi:Carboxypeptidase regulatory-like domain